ncbi:MAG: type VI secretion system ImpA family N-terminal domain-containing protein [Pseudomonadota bacterium]
MEPAAPFEPDFYAPISAAAPTGPALERHVFVELGQLCTEKPGVYNYLEDREGDPVPPDYGAARPVALGLLERSRDLRPMARLAVIEAHVKGATGLHAALHLLHRHLIDYWDLLHPGPAEDPAQLAQRRQALDPLRDRRKITAGLEQALLFEGANFAGPITLRDFLLASGDRTPRADDTPRDAAGMAAIVTEAGAGERVAQASAALTAAAGLLREIGSLLAEKLDRAPVLDPVAGDVLKMAAALNGYAGVPANAPVAEAVAAGSRPDTPPPESAQRVERPAGRITEMAEADAVLDDVLRFYARTAPSSPVGLILLKLRDLGTASFVDWVGATGGSGPDKAALAIHDVESSRLAEFLELEQDDAPLSQGAPLEDVSQAVSALAETVAEIENRLASIADNGSDDPLTAMRDHLLTLQTALAAATQQEPEQKQKTASSADLTGQVTERAHVKTALDRLAAFHEMRDPSSPFSTILRRTKRLVELNYLDILKELAPGGGNPALRLLPPEDKK